MNEKTQGMGIGALIREAVFKNFDEIAAMVSMYALPRFKKTVKLSGFLFFLFLCASLTLTGLGIQGENNTLTAIGRIGLIISGVVLFILAAPIGFVLAGKRYITLVRSFAIYDLLATLILWISPMPITLSLLFGLTLAGGILSLASALGSETPYVKEVSAGIFVLLLIVAYFPALRDRIGFSILEVNEPRLIGIDHGDIASGKIPFFRRGEPAVWYFLNDNGKYELFDNRGNHDLFQDRLKPVTRDVAKTLTNNEDLISPRNFSASKRRSFSIELPEFLKSGEGLSYQNSLENFKRKMNE